MRRIELDLCRIAACVMILMLHVAGEQPCVGLVQFL